MGKVTKSIPKRLLNTIDSDEESDQEIQQQAQQFNKCNQNFQKSMQNSREGLSRIRKSAPLTQLDIENESTNKLVELIAGNSDNSDSEGQQEIQEQKEIMISDSEENQEEEKIEKNDDYPANLKSDSERMSEIQKGLKEMKYQQNKKRISQEVSEIEIDEQEAEELDEIDIQYHEDESIQKKILLNKKKFQSEEEDDYINIPRAQRNYKSSTEFQNKFETVKNNKIHSASESEEIQQQKNRNNKKQNNNFNNNKNQKRANNSDRFNNFMIEVEQIFRNQVNNQIQFLKTDEPALFYILEIFGQNYKKALEHIRMKPRMYRQIVVNFNDY